MEHSLEISRKKNVIIAIPTPTFAEGLKKHFENEGLNVLEVCVVIDHLLSKLNELKEQPSVMLDGIVISSSISKKLSDSRLEFLADIIEKIREDFSETSIIFLSDEPQGHPLLAELVSMGVYNIFVKSQKSEQLNIKQLIRCIDQPKLYSEAKKFRDYDNSIPWRRTFVNGGQPITINIEAPGKEKKQKRQSAVHEQTDTPHSLSDIEESVPPHSGDTKNTQQPVKTTIQSEVKKPKETYPNILEEDLEDQEFLWQLPPLKPKVIVRDRIVGKSVIAVAGLEKGVGTTHASILIANYLASKGYTVKLIECSGNNEFVYIEKAYDGKNVDSQRSDEFEINGVTYVKANSELDMAYQVTSDHSHIILDLGSYEESDYIEEFYRAGNQFLVAPGAEWKQYTINRFIQTNRSFDQSRWTFLIPLVDKQTIKDIKGDNEEISALKIPFHPDPFQSQTDTDVELDQLFDDGRLSKIKRLKKATVFILSGILVVGLISFFIFY